jgi:heme exporter protein A
MASLLSLEKVVKRYGDKTALHPLDIEISEGEFLTVLGANGAGKSTLLKIISQQMRPSSGNISYKGANIKTLGEAYRAKLGVISHQPFLYEGLSAYDNLLFYARLYRIKNPAQRAKEVLTRVELKGRMHDPVRTYSRGMLQRASIARALINSPEIIFLDEPYTGLDRHASYVLTDILKEQAGKQSTVILVTHDLALGYELASKLLILNKGQVVHYGGKDVSEADFEKFYLERVS